MVFVFNDKLGGMVWKEDWVECMWLIYYLVNSNSGVGKYLENIWNIILYKISGI